jgi:hypothetical protein
VNTIRYAGNCQQWKLFSAVYPHPNIFSLKKHNKIFAPGEKSRYLIGAREKADGTIKANAPWQLDFFIRIKHRASNFFDPGEHYGR